MEPAAQESSQAFRSATTTLSVAVLGSSVLPFPYAVQQLGAVLGLGLLPLVAYMNVVLAQVSLLTLLLGTLTGDCALLADVGTRALRRLLPRPPPLLVEHGGRGIMVLLVLCPVLPLCLLRRGRLSIHAGQAVLGAVVVAEALRAGLPALRSGDFPLLRPQLAALPEALSIYGFAFYLAPCLLPLLAEMPPGAAGVRATERAATLVIAGVAMLVYGVIGFFAAARWGRATQGDMLVNCWLEASPRAEGLLNLAMALYLGVSMPPILMACRASVAHLLGWGGAGAASGLRHTALTLTITAAALALALAFPSGAEKIFAVTGSTAVALVCYLLPVVFHLQLLRKGWLHRSGSGLGEALLGPGGECEGDLAAGAEPDRERARWRVSVVCGEVVVPVAVAGAGVLISLGALWQAVQALVRCLPHQAFSPSWSLTTAVVLRLEALKEPQQTQKKSCN